MSAGFLPSGYIDLTGLSSLPNNIEWQPLADGGSYSIDELVTNNNRLWKSKTNANEDNLPPQSPDVSEDANWVEQAVQAVGTPAPPYAPGFYAKEKAWVMQDGIIYQLNVAAGALPYESVDFYLEVIAGDWLPIGLPGIQREALTGAGPYTANLRARGVSRYVHSAGAAFTLALTNAPEGFTANLLIKKTIAGDVAITLPANTQSVSDGFAAGVLTLSGAENSWHELSIEGYKEGATMRLFLVYSGEYA